MAGAGGESIDLDHQVLTEARSHARIVTLNRPRKLNAISFHMIYQLTKLFSAYEDDDNVKLVLLKGSGRSFCAGSDVAEAISYLLKDGNWRFVAKCYADEYTLDYLLATLRKPQVSILNGIVMGGGAGVSIHGRFRIATENAVFAMPETALGLFPDIGSSHFLSRLPGFLGEYCGLTGARLNGAEMLACGLATHYVPSVKLPLLEEKLSEVDVADPNLVSTIIEQFSETGQLVEKSVLHRMDIINKCFSKRSVEEILYSLEQLASTNADDEWIKKTIRSLKTVSPTALKVALRSIREGRLQSLRQCLIREHRMLSHYLRREVSNDFFEGCRALLLEKDKNPKWEPSKLEMVSDEMVDKIFSKIDDKDWEELKLPPRTADIHPKL